MEHRIHVRARTHTHTHTHLLSQSWHCSRQRCLLSSLQIQKASWSGSVPPPAQPLTEAQKPRAATSKTALPCGGSVACIQLSLQCTHTHGQTRPILPSRVRRFPSPVRQGLHRGGLPWSDSSVWSHGPRDSWCGTTDGWFPRSLLSRLTQRLLSHNAVL